MTEVQFVNPGKGSSFYRTTLKNLRTGRVVDVTFKQNESLEDYPVFTHEMQYLYNDGNEYYFMNQETHDQVSAPADVLGTPAQFLVEGDVYQLVMHESEVLGIRAAQARGADRGHRRGSGEGVHRTRACSRRSRWTTARPVPAPAFIKRRRPHRRQPGERRSI